MTTCQSKQISVADAARSRRRLSPTAQSSVPLGRSLEAALRRSPSKHISVEDAAGTPLARRAQSHCGSFETEILIGAGATGWAFPIFFLKIWCQHVLRFIPCLHSRWLHAVFVEFCSETQSEPKTATFLVQISCSCGDRNSSRFFSIQEPPWRQLDSLRGGRMGWRTWATASGRSKTE